MNSYRSRRRRYLLALWMVLLAILVGCARPSQNAQQPTVTSQGTNGIITTLPGMPQIETPAPLPIKNGSVPVEVGVQALALTDKINLKFLIIANDASDFGLDTWKAILDRVGAPYDVFLAQSTPLTSSSLVDTDGSGKYSAILLTNHSLLDPVTFTSYFDGIEWNTLWDYERNYKVRQVSLYTSYGTFPEDYCLRAVSEGGINATPLNAGLSATGARVFPELKAGVQIPITYSYVYRNSIAAGCNATAILSAGGNVLGVISPSADGRERAALTFSSNVNLLQSNLLTYGLLRWASKGVFVGERKYYLNVDVDDWFNSTDERLPNGTFVPGGFRMSAQDALSSADIQKKFVQKYKSGLDKFQLNIAYNAGDADLTENKCAKKPKKNSTGDPLTAATLCVDKEFNWINHTSTHPKLNDPALATLAVIRSEIADNFAAAQTLKIQVKDTTVLKTGEYSGLGVYNPDPNNDIDPPTDYGLMASNPYLLQAAKELGIKYLHGNMSFASHRPGCFNCATKLPMEPSLLIVPDWPTNLAYLATTPDEEASIYNCFFGPNGTCANGTLRFWPQDLSYAQVIEAETDIALQHIMTGSVYSHTLHVGNLREYSAGKNLVFDWLDRLVAKYTTYYSVKLQNPTWTELADYAAYRTSHFDTLSAGAKAVWDRAANRITITSPVAGTLYLTGVQAPGSQNYGGNTIARLALSSGQSLSYAPAGYVGTLSVPEETVGAQ